MSQEKGSLRLGEIVSNLNNVAAAQQRLFRIVGGADAGTG